MNKLFAENQKGEKLAISIGDPAGIGIEVTLKALTSNQIPKTIKPLLIGCRQTIERTYSELKSKSNHPLADPQYLEIEDIPIEEEVTAGYANKATGKASFDWLTHAALLTMNNKAKALVTAPIAKFAWHEAGYKYPGQTERLAEIAGRKNVSMMFTALSPINGWRLNTLLATTHIPLCDVTKNLTPDLIVSKLDCLSEFCKIFKPYPILNVAGVNPHAGENGKLGVEEKLWLKQVLKSWQIKNPTIQLNGPIPPDTCWISSAAKWNDLRVKKVPDGILALYHDQGLIPMKLIAFDNAVNTTLGLPFIRTSPDHGTAFDIAGMGCAKPESMISAIRAACDLTSSEGLNRFNPH